MWTSPGSVDMPFASYLKAAHEADAMGIEAHETHHYLTLGVPPGRDVKANSNLDQFVSSGWCLKKKGFGKAPCRLGKAPRWLGRAVWEKNREKHREGWKAASPALISPVCRTL